MNYKQVSVFFRLMQRDFYVFSRDFKGDVLNMIIWPTSLVFTFGYVLPTFGLDAQYGCFMLVSSLATGFFYLAISFASNLLDDLENTRSIESYLVLPNLPHSLFFFQKATTFALYSTMLGTTLLPIGKLLLGSKLQFEHFSLYKLVLILFASGYFFGFFHLFLGALISNHRMFSHVWRRLYTPMQLLGCYWFSLKMLKESYPAIAYIAIFNPLTYASEGIRAAVFGGEGSINFWISLTLMLVCCGVAAIGAHVILRKRLDFIIAYQPIKSH
jgi:hypothetical protein